MVVSAPSTSSVAASSTVSGYGHGFFANLKSRFESGEKVQVSAIEQGEGGALELQLSYPVSVSRRSHYESEFEHKREDDYGYGSSITGFHSYVTSETEVSALTYGYGTPSLTTQDTGKGNFSHHQSPFPPSTMRLLFDFRNARRSRPLVYCDYTLSHSTTK